MRVTGFKSFVEPTELLIEKGLTGIVGPNGCGKSNLVEALRWAMGEASAKQMRGAEMDDVIFAGTSDRPARNIAEVILSLDNTDRKAPAQFNETDELDIIRRIERGSGSNYRVNGVDFRARDVQTLFADSSTGARSTAMVSQGSIGATISAKPTQRRGLLEEAAGNTGLQSRRHEAELRLRGAETNLERLEDIVGALDEQHKMLKRQARQANRYRNLSDLIRYHEAILLHLRWVATNSEREAAAERLSEIQAVVADITRAVATATRDETAAANALPTLRKKEAEAAAGLQRLMVARDALDAEQKRIENIRTEIENRIEQIGSDLIREQNLRADANTAVENLETESTEIREAQTREAYDLAAATKQLAEAEQALAGRERDLTELTQSVVADETREAALTRQITDLTIRRQRLNERRAAITSEQGQINAAADNDRILEKARNATNLARKEVATARANLEKAETLTLAARTAENNAREGHRVADAVVTKLSAEQEALTELLEIGDPELWPPMIDAVEVDAGYEIALGAALGDDLIAPTDEASPIHWRALPTLSNPSHLPTNARKLGNFVRGPAALIRRISQIGVIDSNEEGNRLHGELKQGQRLVSVDGGLWRWDGYTAAAGAPTSAATRLAQRNRLDEMRKEFKFANRRLDAERSAREDTAVAAQDASVAEHEAREAVWAANGKAQEMQDAATVLAEKSAHARSRANSLKEAIENLDADLADIDYQETKSQAEREGFSDVLARRAQLDQNHSELADDRATLVNIRSAHDRVDRESQARRLRLQAIENELTAWRNRSATALQQINHLMARQTQEESELEKLKARPEEIFSERNSLFNLIGDAESERTKAADTLVIAENRLGELSRDLRIRETELAKTRETRVRLDAEVEQINQNLLVISARMDEKLECKPHEVLSTFGIKPSSELPTQEAAEIKLERLQREREHMGPVNLRAEQEVVELDKKIHGMESEREDLLSAIARLRQGISGLNREGRERLLVAFNDVDQHFRDLFAKLFGGGRAHLRLTQADDPLEAGLEVFASPPGKRLQSMTLLSGGEQALTALALLFAVFLTNPAPICVLDEVDAPLDDRNVDRFCTLLDEMSHQSKTRFLLVTHHRLTMARMDRLYGVTMAERGVSELVSVDLQKAGQLRESA